MSKRMSAGRVRRAYQFIEAHRHRYPVQVMCNVLEVAPSGYYEWLQNPISNRPRKMFLLEAGEEGLSNCVVPAVSSSTHAGLEPVFAGVM